MKKNTITLYSHLKLNFVSNLFFVVLLLDLQNHEIKYKREQILTIEVKNEITSIIYSQSIEKPQITMRNSQIMRKENQL